MIGSDTTATGDGRRGAARRPEVDSAIEPTSDAGSSPRVVLDYRGTAA